MHEYSHPLLEKKRSEPCTLRKARGWLAQSEPSGCMRTGRMPRDTGICCQTCDPGTCNMPPSNKAKLPSPWYRFLEELDGLLREQVQVHCIGGYGVYNGRLSRPRMRGRRATAQRWLVMRSGRSHEASVHQRIPLVDGPLGPARW